MKGGQIKGKRQLAKLMEVLNFITNKFDEYKRGRKEEKGRIKHLEDCLINMSK